MSPNDSTAEIAELRQEVAELRALVKEERAFRREYVASFNDEVSTLEALRLTGIGSRTTLIAERQRPGTPLTHTHHGRSVRYGRAGCIAYKLAHQLAA